MKKIKRGRFLGKRSKRMIIWKEGRKKKERRKRGRRKSKRKCCLIDVDWVLNSEVT